MQATKGSRKKVNVLREISQQIIVTSKRKKIELVLSDEIGHYLAKKFYKHESLQQNEDFPNGIALCIMNQYLNRFDIDKDCDEYTKKAQNLLNIFLYHTCRHITLNCNTLCFTHFSNAAAGICPHHYTLVDGESIV